MLKSNTASAGIEGLESRAYLAADLSVSVAPVSPPSLSLKPGQMGAIAITLSNVGDATAKGPVVLEISGGPNADGTGATSDGTLTKSINLAAGAEKTFRVSKKVPVGTAPGAYYFQVNVDPSNTFDEASVTNNIAVASTAFTVLPPYPVINGLFEGSDHILNGEDKGDLVPSSLDFVSEDQTTGAIVADGTLFNAEHVADGTYTFQGFVTKSGGIKGKAFNNDDDGIITTYAGHFAKGVFKANLKNTQGQRGVFTLTQTTPQ